MKKRTLRAMLSEAQDQAACLSAMVASVRQVVNQVSDLTGNVTVQRDTLAKYLDTDDRFKDSNAGSVAFRVGVIARRFLVWYDRYQQASARVTTLTAENEQLNAMTSDVCAALNDIMCLEKVLGYLRAGKGLVPTSLFQVEIL